MKKAIHRVLPIAAIILSTGSGAFAQEFFRDLGTSRSSGGMGPVYPSEYTYEDASPSGLSPLRPGQDLNEEQLAKEADRYNFAIGPIQFGLAAASNTTTTSASPTQIGFPISSSGLRSMCRLLGASAN